MIAPVRDKVVVTVLPLPEVSNLVHRPQTDTPIRRVRVEHCGPDAEVEVGKVYLANILSGQRFAEDQVVLPSKSGESAFLAEWHD